MLVPCTVGITPALVPVTDTEGLPQPSTWNVSVAPGCPGIGWPCESTRSSSSVLGLVSAKSSLTAKSQAWPFGKVEPIGGGPAPPPPGGGATRHFFPWLVSLLEGEGGGG